MSVDPKGVLYIPLNINKSTDGHYIIPGIFSYYSIIREWCSLGTPKKNRCPGMVPMLRRSKRKQTSSEQSGVPTLGLILASIFLKIVVFDHQNSINSTA